MSREDRIIDGNEFKYGLGCSLFCHEVSRRDLEIEGLNKKLEEKDKQIMELKSIRNNLSSIEQVNEPIRQEINEAINDIYKFFEILSIESLSKRMEIAETKIDSHVFEINEIFNEIKEIKNTLKYSIILKHPIEINEEHKRFLEEQKKIEELKSEYEGEILAFTRKENKLILVAHALLEDELKEEIFTKLRKKEINKSDRIFYR